MIIWFVIICLLAVGVAVAASSVGLGALVLICGTIVLLVLHERGRGGSVP